MRARVTPLLLTLAASGLLGCGSDDTNQQPPGSNTGYKDDLVFETGEFQIPPGDSFECFYTSAKTDHQVNVKGAFGEQGPGGHHITVYYSDNHQEPTHHPCDDAEMVAWHMVAGADVKGSKEPIISLPEGIAFKVPADKQIVVQVHYINTTGEMQTVNDKVTILTMGDEDVQHYASFWTMVDTSFEVAPMANGKHVTTCTVEEDLDTLVLVGHMHELGTHYKLEEVDADNNVIRSIYDHEWQPEFASHPPTIVSSLDAPMKIPAGTRLMQSCDWANNTPDPVLFPREMCISFAVYFPDRGELFCDPEEVP